MRRLWPAWVLAASVASLPVLAAVGDEPSDKSSIVDVMLHQGGLAGAFCLIFMAAIAYLFKVLISTGREKDAQIIALTLSKAEDKSAQTLALERMLIELREIRADLKEATR